MSTAAPTLAVAANFSTEPLAAPVADLLRKIQLPTAVFHAPLDQILQLLSQADGPLGGSSAGPNVILIQWRRWISNAELGAWSSSLHRDPELVPAWVLLQNSLDSFLARSPAPVWIFFCPSSDDLSENSPWIAFERTCQQRWTVGGQVQCWKTLDWIETSDGKEVFDPYADGLAQIPYTPEVYASLARAIVRRFARRVSRPLKVLAVDADDTLWSGVCVETGAQGVGLNEARLNIQRRLLDAHRRGVLLCLCSQNEESDVWSVFDQNPAMLLRRSHWSAARINWRSKATNLEEMARELGLGLDSFLFLDDDPLQRELVRSVLPEVMVLDLPRQESKLDSWLRHQWLLDFDSTPTSPVSETRSAHYEAERSRAGTLQQATTLAELVRDLAIEVECRPWVESDLPRISELILRTNQFNATMTRLADSEVRAAWTGGQWEGLVVSARDRFGDYGLVGALLFKSHQSVLKVEILVVSCRALGRGIESQLFRAAGSIARERGLTGCSITYASGPRNQPALRYLEHIPGSSRTEEEGTTTFQWDPNHWIEWPEILLSNPVAFGTGSITPAIEDRTSAPRLAHPGIWPPESVANALALEGVERESAQPKALEAVPQAATPSLAAALCEIMARVLHLDAVAPTDNFFNLGGASLAMIRVLSRIRTELGFEIPIRVFFDNPTPEGLHQWIQTEGTVSARPGTLASTVSPAASSGTGSWSSSMAAKEVRPHSGATAAPSIEWITIPTNGSPMLPACVDSVVRNLDQFGKRCAILISDDSGDPHAEAVFQQRFRELAGTSYERIRYLGAGEKQNLIAQLEGKDFPKEVLHFALADPEGMGNSTGANRNWLLLATVGFPFFTIDDDAVASPATIHHASHEWRVVDTAAEERIRYFASREQALAQGNPADLDLLLSHEQALAWRNPNQSADRTLLSFNGLRGDCGWGAPFGFWAEPVGCLMLEKESRKHIFRDEAAYTLACTSRDIHRAVDAPTQARIPRCLTGFMGADHRALLPPFIPVGRGQDLFFGRLVHAIHPNARSAYLPWTLIHAPERRKVFSPGELFRTADGMDLAKLFLAILEVISLPKECATPEDRLIATGRAVEGHGESSLDEFKSATKELANRLMQRQMELLERCLEESPEAPEFWIRDVKRYRTQLANAVTSPHLGLPLDMLLRFSEPSQAWTKTRQCVIQFGRLLQIWPELCRAEIGG